MDKKGNYFLGVVLAVFIWIFGILFIPFVIDNIDITRVGLNCTDLTISFGTKLLCLSIDGIVPYMIWLLVSLVLGLIIGGRI